MADRLIVGPETIVTMTCNGCPNLRYHQFRNIDDEHQRVTMVEKPCCETPVRTLPFTSYDDPTVLTPKWCPVMKETLYSMAKSFMEERESLNRPEILS